MSDQQKGLINVVDELFPESEHRFCVRHMWQNFQQQFKGDVLKNQLWKIARSKAAVKYEQYMNEMKEINMDAYKWLHELEPHTWVRAFQSDLPKCDILINNNCEVFNKYILDARELPILSMFERIKGQLMQRHYSKQIEAEKMKGDICPNIKKKVDKLTEWANTCYVDGAGDGVFQVGDRGTDYLVDWHSNECSCKRWKKGGTPCVHDIACARHERVDPLMLVNQCYSVSMFNKAYNNIIYPCRDKSEWGKMNGPPIKPPFYQKQVGRPCKSRRKAPYEVASSNGGKKMSRHGVIMHCNYCGEPDHNIKGCKYKKAGLPPPNVQAPPAEGDDVAATANAEGAPDVQDPHANVGDDEPTITQENNSSENHAIEGLMVDHMILNRPIPKVIAARPIPESTFIFAAQAMLNQNQGNTSNQGSTSTIQQGDLAKRLLLLKR